MRRFPSAPLTARRVRSISSIPIPTRFEYRKSNSSKYACKWLFAAMLIDADHATLEDTEEALNRVRRRLAARIFAGAVIDRLMVRKVACRAPCSAALRPCLACCPKRQCLPITVLERLHCVKSSTLTDTDRPPRSTIVRTLRLVAVPRLPCQPLPLTNTSSGLPMNVSSISTVLPLPPSGSGSRSAIASRTRCAINQAVR